MNAEGAKLTRRRGRISSTILFVPRYQKTVYRSDALQGRGNLIDRLADTSPNGIVVPCDDATIGHLRSVILEIPEDLLILVRSIYEQQTDRALDRKSVV